MKIQTLIVFSLAVAAICTKAQNFSTSVNIAESSTSVSSSYTSAPDSKTSITATPSLESTSVDTMSSPSVSPTLHESASTAVTSKTDSERSVLSASKSILESESISILAITANTTQTVQTSTYKESLPNTTSASIKATTSWPESYSTNYSLNTLSSRITVSSSRTDASEYTSISVERTKSQSVNFTERFSVVADATVPPMNDSMRESLSEMTVTKTFVPGFTATRETTLISGSLESPTPTIKILSSHTLYQNVSSKDSSDVLTTYPFDTPSISIISSVDIATDNESSSVFNTASTSFRTNYFTESVYALANISSSSTSGGALQPSTVASESSSDVMSHGNVTSELADTISASIASRSAGANTSITLSPTQASVFSRTENTVRVSDMLDISTKGYTASATIVSLPSELYSDISLFPSVSLETGTLMHSSSSKSSPVLESRTRITSTPLPWLTATETYMPNIQIQTSDHYYSPASVISSQTVTRSVSVAATTTMTTTTTTTDEVFSTEKHVTTNIPTSTGNFTLSVSEKEHKIYRIMFTFEGDCEIIRESDVLQMEFWKAFMDIIKSMTKLQSYNLDAEQMLCEPLRVYLRIEIFNESSGVNMSQIFEAFKSKIASSNFFVPIIEGMHVLNFTATHFEVLEIISSDINDLEVAKTGLEVVDVVIISIASFLFAVLVLMMIILMCRECYVRKRTTTFHLTDVPHVNLKLSDFTLTRIPRPKMFYRENSLRKPAPVPVSKLRTAQNGHSDPNSNEKMNVNPDNIRIRMSKHEDGLVVGITCSNPPSPKNDSSSCSSSPNSGDQAKKCLLKGETSAISDGVANPSYSTDEELNGNTKLVIQEDENEQLL
ncbi:serine-rich adhesin for platelets-like [Mercenaria mercenaria]|uniref:serine-rich adhesin for platelets-like n=1 Tax=Mercenaria mercenaria TaxID=6596 RepID=UPI00234F9410|nr:serine-rich adhesin for platelets-like [Mercenaria mercenaria]XP_045205693.2 serine-rich adhesin for platelets-like [Mercenaria mercenaria]XP_045205695.2 serine-rich adhesin for platelets-like [Mercenaria mercenaria]XP_053400304.1 serine-rich adhesin for platelets-like [Mercenaria mercenaria]XP_053400305.1 serine-rich adhesin for platelets-like [Mercenaria mercenaria]